MSGESEPATEHSGLVERVRGVKWTPLLPIIGLLALYTAFMPWSGSPAFSSLALHQKAISVIATPSLLGSFYWFLKSNGRWRGGDE